MTRQTPPPERLIVPVLVLAVVAVFARTLGFDFVNFDDGVYVVENPHIREGLTVGGVIWAFTTFYAANWHPLTWISHMIDVALFGLWPGGHHLTSLLLHALATVILFQALNVMTTKPWRSAVVAGLFAVHPLHVESVAWVAERKDVLCGLAWMGCLRIYAEYGRQGKRRWYGLLLTCHGLALMAKPMAVTLPAMLLLLDFWPLQRFYHNPWTALVKEKMPLAFFSAASGVLTLMAQAHSGAVGSMAVYPFGARVANALMGYMAYAAKTVWPLDLAAFYPYRWTAPGSWLTVAAAAFLLLATGLALRWRRRFGFWLTGWMWYLITLVPVIGLVQVGMQSTADRYTYLPLIGLFIALVWAGAHGAARIGCRPAAGISAVLALGLLAGLAFGQAGFWQNSLVLNRHILDVVGSNYTAHTNLGIAFYNAGRLTEASDQLQAALSINPQGVDALIHAGIVLEAQGRMDMAADHYRRALAVDGRSAKAHQLLGTLLMNRDQGDGAVWHLRQAVALNPSFQQAHNNLGLMLMARGHIDAAIDHFEQAARLGSRQAAENRHKAMALRSGRQPIENP